MQTHFATIWESIADAVPDQAAVVQGVRHAGKGGALLGDHQAVGKHLRRHGVHVLEELHGLVVGIAAVRIGNPLALLARFARRWTVPYSPLVLDLMGLQVQVGVVCPEPRFRSGTTPDEYN